LLLIIGALFAPVQKFLVVPRCLDPGPPGHVDRPSFSDILAL
jgi:hypothetical protein